MRYEYACEECGAHVEIQATLEEKERGLRVACPKCGSSRVRQIFSAFGVITRPGGGSTPPRCGPGCCGR